MKYQFCIRFNNVDANSAAAKAVLDCNKIFSRRGYDDYTITVGDNKQKLSYYFLLLKELIGFFFSIKRSSLVGIQYPLLSVNNVFRYFINVAKLKNVKFFCIVHDLESLRTGGKDLQLINIETKNLNHYDAIVVHNNYMLNWLKEAGVEKKMISLSLFDYLSDNFVVNKGLKFDDPIVYAGNLGKSAFIYKLPGQVNKKFNLYGPNFKSEATANTNLIWNGQFTPDQIPRKLQGSFGLIWDGTSIDKCDEILGNYLKYNNPHKCSLYIAAGLPVIAPKDSAIGSLIIKLNIGILINNLYDLENINIDEYSYNILKSNVLSVRAKIISGGYFDDALTSVENNYGYNQ